MAKKTKKTAEVKNELGVNQAKLVADLRAIGVELAKMAAGSGIDATATQLEKIADRLKVKFDKVNKTKEMRAAKKEKLAAKKEKLQAQLEAVEKQLG